MTTNLLPGLARGTLTCRLVLSIVSRIQSAFIWLVMPGRWDGSLHRRHLPGNCELDVLRCSRGDRCGRASGGRSGGSRAERGGQQTQEMLRLRPDPRSSSCSAASWLGRLDSSCSCWVCVLGKLTAAVLPRLVGKSKDGGPSDNSKV